MTAINDTADDGKETSGNAQQTDSVRDALDAGMTPYSVLTVFGLERMLHELGPDRLAEAFGRDPEDLGNEVLTQMSPSSEHRPAPHNAYTLVQFLGLDHGLHQVGHNEYQFYSERLLPDREHRSGPSPLEETTGSSADAPPWRVVEYRCRSCHASVLIDHAADPAKARECRKCGSVPDSKRRQHDHRETSLLWCFKIATYDDTTRVLPPQQVNGRAAGDGDTRGSAATPDEAGAQPEKPSAAILTEPIRVEDRRLNREDHRDEGSATR